MNVINHLTRTMMVHMIVLKVKNSTGELVYIVQEVKFGKSGGNPFSYIYCNMIAVNFRMYQDMILVLNS